jgi:membrane protein DedA with SNARE-associated domain
MILEDVLIYLGAFIGPFIQEDAAVLAAVTAYAHPMMSQKAQGPIILLAMVTGLIVSDLWKYGLGYAGRTQKWAQRFSDGTTITRLREKIVAHPGKTLLVARFVPGTRIPAYIAAGFFGVPFGLFAFWIIASALAYTGVALALVIWVGTIAGQTGQLYVALGVIGLVLIYAGTGFIRAKLKRSSHVDR